MAAKVEKMCLMSQDRLNYIIPIYTIKNAHYSQANSLELFMCNKSMLFTILISKMFEL